MSIDEKNIVHSKYESYPIPTISVAEFIHQSLSSTIEANADHVALIDWINGTKWTYSELDRIARTIGHSLIHSISNPIISTDIVMFYGDNCPKYVQMVLSMTYLGLTITPSTPANGPYETYRQLINSNASILCITGSKIPIILKILDNNEYRSKFIEQLKLLIIIDDCLERVDDQQLQNKIEQASIRQVYTIKQLIDNSNEQLKMIPHFPINSPMDPYVIVYTSGSTGVPKGAIQTHRSFIASVKAMLHKNAFINNRNGIINFIFPLGHISGTVFSINCLCSRMTIIPLPESATYEQIVSLIQKYRVTVQIVSLSLANQLLNDNDNRTRYDLSSLQSMYFSGSRLSANVSLGLIEKFSINMYEVYGATEFMGCVTNNGQYEPGKIGSPLPNVQMKVIDHNDDHNGRALPPMKNGEICFRGPNCFAGYLNNPLATNQTIDSDGWYHSGDIGYFDSDGNLFITDRIKELIKYKHWTVAPSEIEAFLQTHPSIVASCCVGVKHETEGQHIRAYVQLMDNCKNDIDDKTIINYVKDNMGYQNRLNGGVQFVDHVPRISMGKVDRQYFKRLVEHELIYQEADIMNNNGLDYYKQI
ncbi:hypothetical protein RDWZM_010066 [Blomia tropicalis]|uniref:Uncharacterized protein n=1 Tax=Blomia tropicalis TaxID=40697 RepID=A0A9Q0LYL8_BLOTA|nr:hypothetical protein RDWZM_010066 [Blomia tropicalis]